jgi:hypothetical protein
MSLRRHLHERTPAACLALLVGSWLLACPDTNRLSLPPRADRILAWLASALIYLLARWLYAARKPTERRAPRRS